MNSIVHYLLIECLPRTWRDGRHSDSIAVLKLCHYNPVGRSHDCRQRLASSGHKLLPAGANNATPHGVIAGLRSTPHRNPVPPEFRPCAHPALVPGAESQPVMQTY